MAGIPFEPLPSGVEETPMQGDPAAVVMHWARRKAECVLPLRPDRPVLGADTMVELGGRLLGKPMDRLEAIAMLRELSGAWHSVHGGVCLLWPERSIDIGFAESTRVRFRELSDREIACYAGTGEPMDKAGAYGIQGYGAALVDRIEGCFFNVMGLPLARLVRELSMTQREGG